MERIDHFVHQERNLPAISKKPQLHDKREVLGCALRCDRVLASPGCVQPSDEALEDSRLFALELYDAALGLRKASVQSGPEVPRIEGEEVAVYVEGLFVRASADLDGSYPANVC
jgi:hypothetical protein